MAPITVAASVGANDPVVPIMVPASSLRLGWNVCDEVLVAELVLNP